MNIDEAIAQTVADSPVSDLLLQLKSYSIHVDGPFEAGWLIDQAFKEIERLRSASQWRPIEQAPKEFNPIIMCEEDLKRGCIALITKSSGYTVPTHFMPLPEPPK